MKASSVHRLQKFNILSNQLIFFTFDFHNEAWQRNSPIFFSFHLPICLNERNLHLHLQLPWWSFLNKSFFFHLDNDILMTNTVDYLKWYFYKWLEILHFFLWRDSIWFYLHQLNEWTKSGSDELNRKKIV